MKQWHFKKIITIASLFSTFKFVGLQRRNRGSEPIMDHLPKLDHPKINIYAAIVIIVDLDVGQDVHFGHFEVFTMSTKKSRSTRWDFQVLKSHKWSNKGHLQDECCRYWTTSSEIKNEYSSSFYYSMHTKLAHFVQCK